MQTFRIYEIYDAVCQWINAMVIEVLFKLYYNWVTSIGFIIHFHNFMSDVLQQF